MRKNNTQQKHKEAKSNNSWQAMEGLTIGIDLGDGAQAQLDLGRIRARDALVRSVTASFGERSRALLERKLATALQPLLEQIDALV